MDAPVDGATKLDVAAPAAGRTPDDHAGALADVASCDRVILGVGAVMAVHSVDEQVATAALDRTADHFQVPVCAVAQAVLALVAGTDEQFEDVAGRAAIRLLVEGVTARERNANARDRAADPRDDLAARREAVLDSRQAAIQGLLAAADVRDRLAEERDRRADERDRAAEERPFTSREEYEAAALDRGLSAVDRFNAGVDRDRSAGDRAALICCPWDRGDDRRATTDDAKRPNFEA
jgi:hypothetical protein